MIIEVAHPFNKGKKYFEDEESKAKYRRIVSGFAWPGGKPGVIVVVAEDLNEDLSLNVHNLRVLAEAEDSNVEELLRKCVEFRKHYRVEGFYGDANNKPMMSFLRQFNENLSQKDVQSLWLQNAPFVDDIKAFEFYVHTIKNHLNPDKKTLHFFEGSRLSGYLMELPPEEVKSAGVSDYPSIAALGYAISYLDTYGPSKINYPRDLGRKLARSYGMGSLGK